jgi:hypothetical protein
LLNENKLFSGTMMNVLKSVRRCFILYFLQASFLM